MDTFDTINTEDLPIVKVEADENISSEGASFYDFKLSYYVFLNVF